MNKLLTLKSLHLFIVNVIAINKMPFHCYGTEVTNNDGLTFFIAFNNDDHLSDLLVKINYDETTNLYDINSNELETDINIFLNYVLKNFIKFYNDNEIVINRDFLKDIFSDESK